MTSLKILTYSFICVGGLLLGACSNSTSPKKETVKTATTPTSNTKSTQATAAKPKTQPSQIRPKPTLSDKGVDVAFQSTTVKSGIETCVNVAVKQFTDVVSMQYSINWNPKLLNYKAVKGFNLKDLSKNNFGAKRANEGKLTFSWYDQAIKGVSVADNTVIHQICFDAVGKAKSKAKLQITEEPIVVEITGKGGTFLKLFTDTGYVNIQ